MKWKSFPLESPTVQKLHGNRILLTGCRMEQWLAPAFPTALKSGQSFRSYLGRTALNVSLRPPRIPWHSVMDQDQDIRTSIHDIHRLPMSRFRDSKDHMREVSNRYSKDPLGQWERGPGARDSLLIQLNRFIFRIPTRTHWPINAYDTAGMLHLLCKYALHDLATGVYVNFYPRSQFLPSHRNRLSGQWRCQI